MMHSGTRHKKKKNLFHLSQTVVLPLLATTSGATNDEWEREEWETAGECKYTQQLTMQRQWLICINFPQKLIES